MIQKVDDFIKWAKSVFTSILSVVSTLALQNIYKTNAFQNKLAGVFVLIVLIIITSKIFENILEKIIDNSKVIRKLILGKHFIEGYYIDKVYLNDNDIQSLGIIKFEYQNRKFECSGKAFLHEGNGIGKLIGSFKSNSTSYNELTLKVSYDAHSLLSDKYNYSGIAEYNFINIKGTPEEYTGYLYDPHYNGKRLIRAKKINDKRVNKINDEAIQAELISEFLRDIS